MDALLSSLLHGRWRNERRCWLGGEEGAGDDPSLFSAGISVWMGRCLGELRALVSSLSASFLSLIFFAVTLLSCNVYCNLSLYGLGLELVLPLLSSLFFYFISIVMVDFNG